MRANSGSINSSTADAPFMAQDIAVWQANADWLHEMGLLREQADISHMVVDLLAE